MQAADNKRSNIWGIQSNICAAADKNKTKKLIFLPQQTHTLKANGRYITSVENNSDKDFYKRSSELVKHEIPPR